MNEFQAFSNRFQTETDIADQNMDRLRESYRDKGIDKASMEYFKSSLGDERAKEMRENVSGLLNLTPLIYQNFSQANKDLPIVKQRLQDINQTLKEKGSYIRESAGDLREGISDRISTVKTRLGKVEEPDVISGDPESLVSKEGEEIEGGSRKLGNAVQEIKDGMSSISKDAITKSKGILNRGAAIADEAGAIGGDVLTKAGKTLGSVGTGISGFYTGEALGLGSVGSGILGGIEGATSLVAPELQPVLQIGDQVVDTLSNLFKHHEKAPSPPPVRIPTQTITASIARPITTYK